MNEIDVNEFLHDTGVDKFKSVQTITLGQLIEEGIFTWSRVDWAASAYSTEQYNRLCKAFEARFYNDDIGITPVKRWIRQLSYKLNYELMPKYRPMYAQLDAGYDPLQNGGEYAKERRIDSDFPETLLSGNQDYASKGYDYERESIQRGSLVEDYTSYVEQFRSIDAMILDEIERDLFSCLFTTNVNGW